MKSLITAQNEIKAVLTSHIERSIAKNVSPAKAKQKAYDYLAGQKIWEDQETTMLDILLA